MSSNKQEVEAVAVAVAERREPEPELRESLPSFSRLVSTAGTIMRFKAGGLPEPSAAQKAAFESLCDQKTLLAVGLLEAMGVHEQLALQERDNRSYSYYRHDAKRPHPLFDFGSKDGVFARVFASLGRGGWDGLAVAIDALASDVDAAASGEPFRASAREGARLAVHPASPAQLNYPSLGMALSSSGTVVGGKKAKSLGGFMLPRAGYVDAGARGQADRGEDLTAPQIAERMERQWADERAGLGPEEDAEWAGAKDQIEGFPLAGLVREGGGEGHFEKFIAGGIELGAVALSGEAPLPNVRLMGKKAGGRLADNAFSSLMASTSPLATDVLSQLDHLGPRNDRASALSAKFDSTAVAPWGKALAAALGGASPATRPLHEFSLRGPALPSLAGLSWAAKMSSDAKHPRAVAARDAMDKLAELRRGALADRAVLAGEPAPDSHAHAARGDWASEAVRTIGMPEIGDKAWPLAANLMGFDMERVAQKFAARPARLGLLQLSTMMISADKFHRRIVEASQVAGNRYGGQAVDVAPSDAGHLALRPALGKLEAALGRARSAYAAEAFAQAAKVEGQWMEQAGFGPAWRQALAMGEPSTRSIAWSGMNPMSEAISSSDPMQRLAGASSRGLGLSSKLDPARVVQDYKEALAARGASAEGLALIEGSEGARAVLERLGQGMALPQKNLVYACSQALDFACHALSACAEQGFSPEQAGSFLASYADALSGADAPDSRLAAQLRGRGAWSAERDGLARFFMAGYALSKEGSFDGLGPALGKVPVRSLGDAQSLRDLGQAKAKAYPAFVAALASDWRQTLAESSRLGLGEADASLLARTRACEARSAMPTSAQIDWRSGVEGQPTWRLFGIPSPRLSAALLDATARGGVLGKWAADRARKLGIDDARDGNDVVGQVRDKAKAHTGMGDAAWRLAIKDPGSLALLAAAMEDEMVDASPRYSGAGLSPAAVNAFTAMFNPLSAVRSDDVALAGKGPLFGVALSAAAVGGISAQDAADVGAALMSGSREANLFGMEIQPQICQGGQGAEFYCQETLAKRERLPKLFVEACRRYQKIKGEAAKAQPVGADGQPADQVDPKRALADEVTDLVDWISGSEQGLWVQLPKEPTWGQLRRLSKAWHDEQALIAVEKASRQKLSKELSEAKFEESAGCNPFMVKNSTRWARLLGAHASEGWEAVELQSSADLTEEGAAMHHCVSSYSGTCREGKSRVFSIRLNGERVSTLEIQGSKPLSQIEPAMDFAIHQNKGAYNATPTKQCRAFCEEVLDKIQGAWPKQVASIERKLEERKADLMRLGKERKAELDKSLAAVRAKAGGPK